ncbi:MAG: hypothetical protein H6545_01685 [Bacteroidales bacterium]|nr:hypothetical protein [Bacteroidales bacterium]
MRERLVYTECSGRALTWMDAVVDDCGAPAIALWWRSMPYWYNALLLNRCARAGRDRTLR